MTLIRRSSGILLHPTSLPGPHGIGDLGPAVRNWLDWLARAGCRHWQVLPLVPTGYGDSPYQGFSVFAGNPNLISPEALIDDGLVDPGAIDDPGIPEGRLDLGSATHRKEPILEAALERFLTNPPAGLADAARRFIRRHRVWLDDYALFAAIRDERGGSPWWEWPDELRRRASAEAHRDRLGSGIERHVFRQFVFHRQWERIRRAAADLRIGIIGDLPFFAAADSADVWSNPHLFQLDEELMPRVVAGVPPDYFSETGQRWGNPIYDWQAHADDGYGWWIRRVQHMAGMVDLVRIDHFRGFVDYWEIPAGATTARDGRWVDGPGRAVFDAIEAALGDLPFIAEDLGELHPGVPALRDALGLPGMEILQFAFEAGRFRPERIAENCVAYTGTHDNDTVLGWYRSASRRTKARIRWSLRYVGPPRGLPHRMIRSAWESNAALVVAPLQDVLRLGSEARMNRPGTAGGNWQWRIVPEALTADSADWMSRLNRDTHRLG